MKNILFAIFATAITFASCSDNAESNPEKEIILKLTRVESENIHVDENGEEQNNNLVIDVFTHNKDGYVSSLLHEDNKIYSYKDIFTYDSEKKITEVKQHAYDSHKKEMVSSASKIYQYTYNEKGLIESEKEYDIDSNGNSTLSHTKIYTYNEENLVITQIQKDNKDNITEEEHYEYDRNRNIVKYTRGKLDNTNYTTYTYDTKKNPFSVIYPKAYCLIKPLTCKFNNSKSSVVHGTDNEGNKTKKVYEIEYDYNNEGYPTKLVVETTIEDGHKYTHSEQYTYEQ